MNRNNKPTENPFIEACRHMHDMANICRNWVGLTSGRPTDMVHYERGCMRSTQLAWLAPVTHEPTAQSALQLVVLPESFNDVLQRGYDHSRWQLMVYSWLGRELTLRLREELASKTDLSSCTFFLVEAKQCVKL